MKFTGKNQYMDIKEAWIDRSILGAQPIYEHELEQLFAKSWQVITHAPKQINYFYTTNIDEDGDIG